MLSTSFVKEGILKQKGLWNEEISCGSSSQTSANPSRASGVTTVVWVAMPRSNMSTVEQIANWEWKAVEAQLQLLEHKITVAMRNKPSIVRPLWEKCLALGITDENVQD
eukprot:6480229-Amphidinium_carterae.1